MNKFLCIGALIGAAASLDAVTIRSARNNSHQDAFIVAYNLKPVHIGGLDLGKPMIQQEPAIEPLEGIIYKLTRDSIAKCVGLHDSIALPEKDLIVVSSQKGQEFLSGKGNDFYDIEIALDGSILVLKNGVAYIDKRGIAFR